MRLRSVEVAGYSNATSRRGIEAFLTQQAQAPLARAADQGKAETMPASLCNLAKTLPLLIGRLLDQEASLKRGRFREETMTDIFTGALAAFAGPELVLEYPTELDTGGDLDLCFWHVASGRELNLRIQAKRLNASKDGTRHVKIEHRAYRELLHMPASTKVYQFKTLLGAPPPLIPLYMLYNHHSVVADPYFGGIGPKVSGVNLAFATDIGNELEAKLAAAPASIKHHKRLSYLRKHLFGLDAILCPGGLATGATVPSPHSVQASLRERWRQRGDLWREGESELARRLAEPIELVADTTAVRRISDGPSIRVVRSLERPLITFISGRTTDHRTPVIADEPHARRG